MPESEIVRPEGLREQLEALVEAELQALAPENIDVSSRLPEEIPELFTSSAFLTSELARVSSKAKVAGLDSARYSLPAPPGTASVDAWQKALDNAGSQTEHQQLRLGNLELMNKYGANAWRVGNYLVEKEIERLQSQTEIIKTKTEEVNRERKAKQVRDIKAGIACPVI